MSSNRLKGRSSSSDSRNADAAVVRLPLESINRDDFDFFLPPGLLVKPDRCGMGVSLRTGLPHNVLYVGPSVGAQAAMMATYISMLVAAQSNADVAADRKLV